MLTDLGGVTRTLQNLVDVGLRLQKITGTEISAAPPDQTFTADAVVSVYLYHVLESPEFKNAPGPPGGTSPVPISLSPLGLILQYVITVVTNADTDVLQNTRALQQQQYTGFIARVIHDNPIITPDTKVTVPDTTIPVVIMDPTFALTNKKLEFVIRPAPKEETVSFWSSEEKHVPRLTLFIEARVAVLEAQPPLSATGIVLSVGQFVFPNSSPQLLSTQNDVWFLPPPNFGTATKVTAIPARVALFDSPTSTALADFIASVPAKFQANFANNNRLTISAVGLENGHRLLLLRQNSTTISIDLDQPLAQQPQVNQDWKLQVTSDSVSLSVFQAVFDSISQSQVSIIPGSYGARVSVVDSRVPEGSRPMPRTSNEVTFTITPQIVSAAPATVNPAPRTYTIAVLGSYLNSDQDIQLAVGGRVLQQVNTGAPTDGQYLVPAAPATTNQITLVLRSTDPDTGATIPPPSATNPVPIQLVVNGATATPAWLLQEAT
jgi:hypothetical protein